MGEIYISIISGVGANFVCNYDQHLVKSIFYHDIEPVVNSSFNLMPIYANSDDDI